MSFFGVQDQLLEITVVCCTKLKDAEWISRQDPYVCLEYGSTKYRTRTCTDGGKNPTFQEKFVFTLIEGLPELNIVVWNSNTLTYDDFIGSGKVQLRKVLSQGYDDSSWPLQDKKGRHAGEVRLIMHYSNANKPATSYAPSAPPFGATMGPQAPLFSAPPSAAVGPYNSSVNGYSVPSSYPSYPPASAGYPPSPYHSQQATYPPSYPPYSGYPPSPYPPPPQNPHYYPPGSYPPSPYPPPPY